MPAALLAEFRSDSSRTTWGTPGGKNNKGTRTHGKRQCREGAKPAAVRPAGAADRAAEERTTWGSGRPLGTPPAGLRTHSSLGGDPGSRRLRAQSSHEATG